jgi:hypothetical protein
MTHYNAIEIHQLHAYKSARVCLPVKSGSQQATGEPGKFNSAVEHSKGKGNRKIRPGMPEMADIIILLLGNLRFKLINAPRFVARYKNNMNLTTGHFYIRKQN